MKKRVHKNQIVITTLAVLIAVAGYVTYDKKGADIKDAETVANMNQGAVSDQADKDYETGEDLDITSSKEDLADASTEDVENRRDGTYLCDKRGFRLCSKSET